jgi:hypothetical protein
VNYCKTLCRNSSGQIEGAYENSQSAQSVFRPGFKPGTSRVQIRSFTLQPTSSVSFSICCHKYLYATFIQTTHLVQCGLPFYHYCDRIWLCLRYLMRRILPPSHLLTETGPFFLHMKYVQCSSLITYVYTRPNRQCHSSGG